MLLNILSFIFVFTIIALTHEIGHLVWAKKAGVRVFELGIGFGPRLFAFEKNNTTYSLNMIPILAFVRIAGEGDSPEDVACPTEEKFQAKRPWPKFKMMAAGPFMNLLSAFVIFSLAFFLVGIPSKLSNEIGAVNKNSPAEKAGLKVGDKLLAINGVSYPKIEDAIDVIHKNADKSLTLTIERNRQKLQVTAVPKFNKAFKSALLGFAAKPIYERVNLLSAIYQGAAQTVAMTLMTLFIFGQLLIGAISITNLSGPIGIAQITGQYAQSGFISLIHFTAFISVNIGVLNLLPIPALDGGRIVFVIIEVLRRKPINPQIENKFHYWGLIALLSLMALVSVSDLLRIFKP